MHELYLIPNWFFGFDIGMEMLFAVVTILVSIIAFRIYSMTEDRKVKLFGLAFLFIGLSYIAWAGINLWFTQLIGDETRELSIESIATIGVIGLYSYIILFISGLINLVSTTCESYKGRAYYLLFGLSLLVIVSSINKLITFRIVSAFLLFFVAYHYFEEYLKNKNKKTLYVMLAITLLFISNVTFIFFILLLLLLCYRAYS
jgi:uncharacterized protein involved in response to NO